MTMYNKNSNILRGFILKRQNGSETDVKDGGTSK